MQVRLLGPVDVVADGAPRQVNGLRRKAVLATLALTCGEVVSTGHLANVVWGDTPPPTAMNTLQNHVSHLRRVLGSGSAIVARPPGYVLDLGGDGTDVQAVERLLREGTRAEDPVTAAGLLRQARELFRGRPLSDVTGLVWLEEQASRLEALGVQVERALCEALLAAGEHAQLIGELERIAAGHPLDEQVCGQLMVALYRSGRQADALAAYHRLRGCLAEELGIGPGQPLRDLETAILRQDPALDLPARAVAQQPPSRPVPVPAQLPSAVAGFTGRQAELASLDAAVAAMDPPGPGGGPDRHGGPGTVVISAVSGAAGVGKTALAVHWAHRAAARFPDGQLYVNLRGFDPGGEMLDPAVAVRGFLDALGVTAARIPQGLQAQAALYRSLLAGKRVLVVLDNARDSAQVRPLLPGSPGCLALVTSRNQLGGLVAAEGAVPLMLGLLSTAEARDLLTARLGADRTTLEPEAVDEIIDRCARLPLALTIVAARAATHPQFTLATITAELSQAGGVLDSFGTDDAATNVRAVFSWSCQALSPQAARLFRLLGLHPGPDISLAAAASLAAIPPATARALLAELTSAHMLTEHRPRRYAFHDLLRAYAAEQARATDQPADRDAAISRVLDHYLHTALAAWTLTDSGPEPIVLDDPLPGVVVDPPGTADDVLAWFTAEYPVLLAAVQLAVRTDQDLCVWRLAWALGAFLLRRGLFREHTTALEAGLAAARRTGDTLGEANCLHSLGSGYCRSGRYRDAEPLFWQALRLFETIGGYFNNRAAAHNGLIWVSHALDRPGDMLHHSEQTVEMYRKAGNQQFELMALNDLGFTHAKLGNYAVGLAHCERALAVSQELGERHWEYPIWHSLGFIHHQLGDHEQAIASYQRSLQLCRADAERYGEADALAGLGEVYHDTGDHAAARQAWQQALRIFDEIGHPRADEVRAKLTGASQPVRQG